MKNISSIVLILSASLMCGCEDFLDAKPERSLVIPDSLDDFQALLDAEPRSMNSVPKMGFLSSDEIQLADPLVNLLTLEEKASYLWEGDFYSPDDAGVDWAFSYRKVFYANIVIDGLKDFTPKNSYEAQRALELDAAARFYRAFAHFSLAGLFMGPYDPSNPDLPGIPIRKSADLNATSPRVKMSEVFEHIKSDLEISRSVLPLLPDIPTRASAWAAEALLSRVNLYMQDYEAANFHATNALKIKDVLMDYNLIDPALRFVFSRFNSEVIHHAHIFTGRFSSSNQTYLNQDLLGLFESTDLRRTKVIVQSPVIGKFNFQGRYSGETSLFGGLATDEVLLDRAESAARTGNESQALADLNRLLINRYQKGSFVPLTGLSGKMLIVRIADERRKELLFRGIRWLDLKRYNQDPEMAKTLTRIWNGKQYNLDPGSSRYTLPIPPRELRLNELL